MVRLTKIYTRTGDDGTTALSTGKRLPKYDLRIESYGTVDETNAAIGVARLALGDDEAAHKLDNMLSAVQNDLFDLGADLSTPTAAPKDEESGTALRIVSVQVERVEADIDSLNAALSPLTSFILPGGSQPGAALHLARTICRRAERLMTALKDTPDEHVSGPALRYINRLSDFLFVASRYINDKGKADILWVPGKNR